MSVRLASCRSSPTGSDLYMLLSVVFAVLASVLNAVASVLQRKAARRQPESSSFELRLVWDLLHEPAWLGGVAAIVLGFLLQAAALSTGPIALVQPILILELGFTLILSSLVFRTGLRPREWVAVVGMSAGIALLLFALRPTGGDPRAASGWQWVLATGVTLGVVAVFLLVGMAKQHSGRAAYLGLAAGVSFGFTAALLAVITTTATGAGATGVFTAWQTYALIVAGPGGFFLLQNALQSGRLVASQPALTLSNPLTALGWGVTVFGEQVRSGWWILAEVVGAALIASCTLLLARSPSLRDQPSEQQPANSSRS